ncbi:coiled-coil domain-containing protein 39 [Holotrichia oblita]|uniref:Coiled-coil domain-containing protein 39 n=1 Tax=Holotrichia oblita TaxID=644536 RepID=A0ACB9THQ8_HOLOL|nr:coiled-coil domain-containing protein 39 [Holotrichia oblita]
MSMNMNEILQEIGWSNGFHVPVANAENQALEAELERLTTQKVKAKAVFDSTNSRTEALAKHLKYVTQEAEQNQIDSENNKLKGSLSEFDRVNQEIRGILKDEETLTQRNELKKNDLAKSIVKLEKLKAETAWDEEALKAWEESLKKRDDDNEMIKKFAKSDERKINDLEAKRRNLQMEVVGKKDTVARMVAEITNYEQILERTGKLFKNQELERTALVAKWQDAVKHLRQRDADIQRINRDIYMTELAIENQGEIVQEQKEFLANEKNHNKGTEEEINELNSVNSRIRKELNDLLQYILRITNELNALKRTTTVSAVHLDKERIKGKNMEKEIQNFTAKINKINADLDESRSKLVHVNTTMLSSAERAAAIEQLINEEQRRTNIINLDSEKIQGILYRNQVHLQELRNIMKNYETEISGCEVGTRMLEKRCKIKLAELQVQKELIYSLDYRINEMEVQISTWEGQSKVDEETEAMNAKIAELEQILAEHTEVKNFLQGQVTRLEDEMRRLSIAISTDTKLIETLRSKLQDQILSFEGGVKQAAAAKLKSQEKQVEENVLRLKVSQLEKAITKENDNIYDLQKFRIELETALRERQIEINTHKDILTAQRKNLDEARGRLRADINLRKIRVEQFRKKHHIVLMTLGKDEDGQPLSIAHFKLKNAQEKYMLQQEGDEIDNKIKKAEKEIIAMENTLKIINVSNATYKKNLACVDEEKIKEKLDELHDKQMEEAQKLGEIRGDYANLKKEEEPRDERLKRTCKQLRELKKRISPEALEKPERNLEIRQLQDANRSALQQIAEISVKYPEITPLVNRYIYENKLKLPEPRTKLSSSSSSVSSYSLPTERSVGSNDSSACSRHLSQVVLTFDGVKTAKKTSKQRQNV